MYVMCVVCACHVCRANKLRFTRSRKIAHASLASPNGLKLRASEIYAFHVINHLMWRAHTLGSNITQVFVCETKISWITVKKTHTRLTHCLFVIHVSCKYDVGLKCVLLSEGERLTQICVNTL